MKEMDLITNFTIVIMLLLSLNVNGLRDIDKLKSVFTSIKSRHATITLLQETFWDDHFIETHKHLWDGKIFYNNCPNKNRRGVAILISKECSYDFTFNRCDTEGRILKIDMKIDKNKYSLINVYAPNNNDERYLFYNELNNYIDSDNTIIAGDFNEILDPALDLGINNTTYNVKNSNKLHSLISDYCLVDIWRNRNPGKKEFSRSQIVQNVLKQSRIDLFLISRNIIQFAINSYISYTTLSDHNFLSLKLDFSRVERGQGTWIFNNELLQDEAFCYAIIDIINNNKECPLYQTEPLVWWDNFKYKIKKCATYFATKKRKLENEKYYFIQNALRKEYAKLAINKHHDLTTLQMLLEELKIIEITKCNGAILRSKAQWNFECDKNTSFFLNLEKSKQESNSIKELNTNNGLSRKTEDILDYVHQYYSKLYTRENIHSAKEEDILNLITNKINEIERQNCDKEISIEELTNALKGMNRNKSPGIDGITVEFYIKFWDKLKHLLHKVIISIQEEQQLSRSMKKGIISLFYKKKGDKTDIKNFRPISLLNVDYKIISKALANRLKLVMESIISPEQTCCVPGRDIADNIMSIRDVIDYIDFKKEEGFLIKIDQEKAFDRVSHSFIIKVLNKFNFGNKFISWIKILYNDIKSSVKINGHLTPYFPITRGVRQGCPISMMLYVIVAEPLNNLIKNQQNIKGIRINPDINSLLFQHADDTTITVQDAQSVEAVFNTVNKYCLATGAKVNIEKSEVLCLGKASDKDLSFNIPITVNTNCVQILGIYLGPNKYLCEKMNWKIKIEKIKAIINMWKQRKLTLNGKATVWNTLLTSRLWYHITVIHVPKWVEQEIQKMFCNFMWDNKIPLIKYSTIIGNKYSGGLNIQDINLKKMAFRVKLLNKYFNDDFKGIWKYTMSEFLGKYMNMNLSYNIFNIIYNESDLVNINPFYAELLLAWDTVSKRERYLTLELEHIMNQPLFGNPHIKYKNKLLHFQSYIESGITTVADISYEVVPGFLSKSAIVEILQEKYPNMSIKEITLAYNVILNSLPDEWKQLVINNVKVSTQVKELCLIYTNDIINCNKFTVKLIYSILITHYYKQPTGVEKWENMGFNMCWKTVWKHIHCFDKTSDFIELDYKIVHNIIYTYSKLYKYGKTLSNQCPVCKKEEEDMTHLFLYCDELYDLIEIFNEICIYVFKDTGYSPEILKQLLLFGCYFKIQCSTNSFINKLLSIYRMSVFKRRLIAETRGTNIDIVKYFKHNMRQYFIILLNQYTYQNRISEFHNKYIKDNLFLD